MNKLTPKEGRDLTKDIIYLCEDKAFLESIIDEYVWLIDDKTVEELQEYVNKELEIDFGRG
mgnify:CR=1 FL=1|tara:strand:+ start:468 stop:650 length:183 start_codon:yes stop_codon:yes gene_type:complete